MNFEELHNELNSYPEDLKFQDAHWDQALKGIKRYELKQRLKYVFSSLAILLLIGSSFYALQNETNAALAEYTPRTEKISEALEFKNPSAIKITNEFSLNRFTELEISETLNAEENLFKNTLKTQTADLAGESSTFISEETAQAAEETPEFLENPENYQSESLPLEELALDAKRDENSETTESGIENEIENDELGKITTVKEQHEPKVQADIEKNNNLLKAPEFKSPPADLKVEEPSYSFITPRFTGVRIDLSKKPRGEKQKIHLSNDFQGYLRFNSLKIGIIPFSEFGRSNRLQNTDYSIGLFHERPLSQQLSVNFGASYFEISGMDTPISSSSITYRFGFESTITTVSTNKIRFVNLPANLAYRITPRIQAEAGLGINYLINSKNTLENHLQTNTDFELLSSEKTSGYFTAYNQVLMSTNFGLSYWIDPQWKLGLNYQYGLSDLTKNEIFNNQNKDRNSMFSLTLNRVIFK